MTRIPDIPGTRVPPRSDHETWLKSVVAGLCHLDHDRHVRCSRVAVLSDTGFRFPGSQPISFSLDHLNELEKKECVALSPSRCLADSPSSYWVCEKSDGIRVLFFLQTDPTGSQAVYLVSMILSFPGNPQKNVGRSTGITRTTRSRDFGSLAPTSPRSRLWIPSWTANSSLTSIQEPNRYTLTCFIRPFKFYLSWCPIGDSSIPSL